MLNQSFSNIHGLGYFVVAVDFVEVHVAVDLVALLVDDANVGLVFLNGRDFAQFGANRRQLCRAEINEGVFTQAVREVSGGSGHDSCTFVYLGLVTHTQ